MGSNDGCQYHKKSFTNCSGGVEDIKTGGNDEFAEQAKAEAKRLDEQFTKEKATKIDAGNVGAVKHKVIPLGNRILVKRRRVGNEIGKGIIVAAQETAERPTDLADVVYIPEHTFADKSIIEKSEDIVKSLTDSATKGDYKALEALLSLNYFLKVKSLKPGDCVFISKYIGTDFNGLS